MCEGGINRLEAVLEQFTNLAAAMDTALLQIYHDILQYLRTIANIALPCN